MQAQVIGAVADNIFVSGLLAILQGEHNVRLNESLHGHYSGRQ